MNKERKECFRRWTDMKNSRRMWKPVGPQRMRNYSSGTESGEGGWGMRLERRALGNLVSIAEDLGLKIRSARGSPEELQ